MRLIDKASQPFREPMIAASLPAVRVHPLLDHHPTALVRNDEAVEIKLKPVLDCRAVHLCDQAACGRERSTIESGAVADRLQLMRGLPGIFPAPAAYVNSEFALERGQPALQSSNDAGRDAGRM